MELQLQLGYGMMDLCYELTDQWQGGTTILSPRDLDDSQLERFSKRINSLVGGRVWLDPQFYLPHSDHKRLVRHLYWPENYDTGVFFSGLSAQLLINDLRDLNDRLNTESFIVPGLLAPSIDKNWLNSQSSLLQESRGLIYEKKIIQTIALSSDAIKSKDSISEILESIEENKADGYYIVCEHPKGSYLVEDTTWVFNVLDLVAGIKLQGCEVYLGYCNHQMLASGASKADGMASGTWMNVRAFPPDKFKVSEEDSMNRATWYYCCQALSEYKLEALDLALARGVLGMMACPPNLMSPPVQRLFSGGQPATLNFKEGDAFRHYLNSLKFQVDNCVKGTFDETIMWHQDVLDSAKRLLDILVANKVRGKNRDFNDVLQTNKDALDLLVSDRGPMLRRRWHLL